MRISAVIRAMRPIDLLLPAGAALVSAGLHQLAERERRGRGQLAQLQQLVDEHRGALAAAGVPIPGELAEDERHPLDVPTPWDAMGVHLADEAPDKTPDNSRRRGRGWKLAAAALVGVAGVTLYANRGRLLDELLVRAGIELGPEDFPSDPTSSAIATEDPPVVREPEAEKLEVGLGDPNKRSSVPVAAPALSWPVADDGQPAAIRADGTVVGTSKVAAESCGWPGCEWQSEASAPESAQRTAAAVHRNRCTFRPAGAVVPGA